MPFPQFSYCIVCEGVRPEVGGKLTILGFYGLTPNVEIAVANPNLPLNIVLVAAFPPVPDAGAYDHSFVIHKPDDSVIVRTAASRHLMSSPELAGWRFWGLLFPHRTRLALMRSAFLLTTNLNFRPRFGFAQRTQQICPVLCFPNLPQADQTSNALLGHYLNERNVLVAHIDSC